MTKTGINTSLCTLATNISNMKTKSDIVIPLELLKNPIHLLSTGFGSGLSPFAPGTAGTAVALIGYLLLPQLSLGVYIAMLLVLSLLGIYLCHSTSQALGVHDHSGIVFDEIVGYLVTMTAAPAGIPWALAGFALFRLFDVWKPWPISWLDQHVHGGLGIMLDDILAGIAAMLVIQVAAKFIV